MITWMATVAFCGLLGIEDKRGFETGYLCQAAYVLDDEVRGPAKRYVPQSGDIFLSTDRSLIINAGHRIALSGQPNHSGIVVVMPNGRPAILEGGPFNGLKIEIIDLLYDLAGHEQRSEKVWIRARKTPLTKEQQEELVTWALNQNGKPFAARRMLRQMTPVRTRGPLRTYVMGYPNGERDRYFCAELVMETVVHLGLVPFEIARPSATYPEDLFYDKSKNKFLNEYFSLAEGWHPPARWLGLPQQGKSEVKTAQALSAVKTAPSKSEVKTVQALSEVKTAPSKSAVKAVAK